MGSGRLATRAAGVIGELEFLLDGPRLTKAQAIRRLGYASGQSLWRILQRHGRLDLWDRLYCDGCGRRECDGGGCTGYQKVVLE